jgi:hypothetical protein
MPLVADLDNNGNLDLLVTTMNGNAFALQTEVAATPQAHWLQQVQCGANGATWGVGYHGVHVLPASRVFRDVVGASVQLSFEVRQPAMPPTRAMAAITSPCMAAAPAARHATTRHDTTRAADARALCAWHAVFFVHCLRTDHGPPAGERPRAGWPARCRVQAQLRADAAGGAARALARHVQGE